MTKAEIITSIVKGAYSLAMKRERSANVAKEWAQEAILKAIIEYDRYAHLPDNEKILVLGRICANAINSMQRKEVEKDKRERQYNEEIEPSAQNDKVLDDGHYEPYVHHIREEKNLAWYPPSKWEDQLEVCISKELLTVILSKLDKAGRTFVMEKLMPSDPTIKLMQEEGFEHPLDRHIFPDLSKASISRIKSRVLAVLVELTVL